MKLNRAPLFVFVLCFCLPVSSAAKAPKVPGTFLRARTPHFTIYSNASERKTRRLAVDLERFSQTLLFLLPGTVTAPSEEMVFYVFRGDRDFERYTPSASRKRPIAGYYTNTGEGSFAAVNAGAWDDYRHTLFHEYVHEFLRRNYRPLPGWLDEGLSEYFSTFRLDGTVAEIGRPIENYVTLLRNRAVMSLDELFTFERGTHGRRNDAQIHRFYAESWALVHYLMLGDRGRAPELMRYVQAIQSGVPLDEAFSAAFSCSREDLLQELRVFISKNALPFSKFPLDGLQLDESVNLQELSDTEALCALGELIAHSDRDNLAGAEEHFGAAVARNPNCARAHHGLGYIADRRGRHNQAEQHFEKALRHDPGNATALFRFGRNLLHRLQDKLAEEGGATTPEAFEAARRLLRKSLEIEPEAPTVWATLGFSYALDPQPPPGGIEIMQRAIQLRGPRWTLVSNLAVLFVKEGQWQTSREIFETYLRPWREPRAYWRLESWLVDAALDHLQTLAETGRACEALVALHRLAEITEHEESLTKVITRLELLQRTPEGTLCEEVG
ncbi:MAG: tetratricopeptide repeat protein [Thermoanaerobaculales bacterium]|nr:tetratricopeptide repeat protein [Thermoanaerobaculales bacterium]